MDREEVYEALDTEREYQEKKWRVETQPLPQALIDIELHMNRAKGHMYNLDLEAVMHELRKVGALTVKYGEKLGMPKRSREEIENV